MCVYMIMFLYGNNCYIILLYLLDTYFLRIFFDDLMLQCNSNYKVRMVSARSYYYILPSCA